MQSWTEQILGANSITTIMDRIDIVDVTVIKAIWADQIPHSINAIMDISDITDT
jgi:hypothetical protein